MHRRRASIGDEREPIDPERRARGGGGAAGLALIRTGDRVRIDLNARRVDMLVDEAELDRRRGETDALLAALVPPSQTPWQEIQRAHVGQFDTGAVLENAVKYQRIASTMGAAARIAIRAGRRR